MRREWSSLRRGAPRTPGGRLVRRRVGFYRALLGLIAVMFAGEITMHFTGSTWSRWIIAAIALAATGLALGAGLTPDDLGLSRSSLRRGAGWAGVIVVVVVLVIAVGLAVPPIRELFRNEAYSSLPWAVLSALVLIPLQTVVPEELLFRGILLGALARRHRAWVAVLVQALLFGLWHIVSSTGLAAGNPGIGNTVGDGTAGVLLGVLGAVVFTTVAGALFGWLRMRTGSLLPSIAMHWAANGAGAIAAALAWQLS
ncbi:hypothetical protein GOHSU_04_00690 [Gordonia hirsuta DSM 44140 = NBRC 16056]|uniref:CAAX prenyl protease 2/Lysostaphin resistance protein A-like domain-containing protein n=1 Tax=Gordonia hirsuta DSM 44140 = NBRC 16056 TaxID=1121927 RepID=L7L4X7_9ACTN|nr:CPBP family intramembrane glutamic endopeptidase [Gordonia hirsuta]GAC56200.1 hypothetical protein GOHSU_04_00690 [Gordonia hirsuta DSM 44140 = NBRC 16056]